MKGKARYFQMFSLMAIVQPIIAEAHPMHWPSESIGFLSGLIHPLSASDHIITMLIVGFWISQANRRTPKLMIAIFVSLILMGVGLTLIPVEIANTETIMNLSVITLGLILISGHKVSSLFAVLVVGNLALFYGYVHAYDIWLDRNGLAYTAGFALATEALITVGIAIRSLIDRFAPKNSAQFMGRISEQ